MIDETAFLKKTDWGDKKGPFSHLEMVAGKLQSCLPSKTLIGRETAVPLLDRAGGFITNWIYY